MYIVDLNSWKQQLARRDGEAGDGSARVAAGEGGGREGVGEGAGGEGGGGGAGGEGGGGDSGLDDSESDQETRQHGIMISKYLHLTIYVCDHII